MDAHRPARLLDRPSFDLALFAATVAAAAALDWSATDLVWSLWISSLVVGYALVFTAIALGEPPEPDMDHPVLRVLERGAGWVRAVFLLVFFTVHFGFFHFLHSVFLNDLFPLVGDPAAASTGPVHVWWGTVIETSVTRYWPFLVTTAFSYRSYFVEAFQTRAEGKGAMLQPYLNVIRMHLLLLAYAALDRAGFSGWFLYLVLFFYFFPLGAIWDLTKRYVWSPSG